MIIFRNEIIKSPAEIQSLLELQLSLWTGVAPYHYYGDYSRGSTDALKLTLSTVKSFEYRHCCGDSGPLETTNVCYTNVLLTFQWLRGENDNFLNTFSA